MTLPVSLFNLGLVLGTLPAAFVMRRFGRRNGYLLGAGRGELCPEVSGIPTGRTRALVLLADLSTTNRPDDGQLCGIFRSFAAAAKERVQSQIRSTGRAESGHSSRT